MINGGGFMNAFATRFLGKHLVVFHSEIVDSVSFNPEAISFYMGHELGHIKRQHFSWGPYLWPSNLLPLIGAAYSRTCEYTCDQFGRACCKNPESAVQGLVALAAGKQRWSSIDTTAYLSQADESRVFGCHSMSW